MGMDDGESAKHERPLLQRIVEFPLVALIVAILLFAFATALGLYLGKLVPAGRQPGAAIVHAAINITLMLATYKLAIGRLGEQPRDDLPARGMARQLGLGVLAGTLLFSLVVGVAAALGVYRIAGSGGTSMLLLGLISAGIMPGFMEEMLFRGILFRWIEEFAGSWAALVITSTLFGLAHILNPNATWFSSLAIAVEAGLLLGAAYMFTRSLWLPIGLHAAWNFTQGPIFGVPVSGTPANGIIQARLGGPTALSGGGFGLEASVIAVVIATAAGLWFVWAAVRRGALVQPWWVRRRRLIGGSPIGSQSA
jgi:membrane protease YdiL (CAAX protease family)